MNSRSRRKLESCHTNLQLILQKVDEIFPIAIIWGYRGQAIQTIAFEEGNSTKPWPRSKHNEKPSIAVDIAPLPVIWEKTDRFKVLGGVVIGVAYMMGIPIIWGGDWDGDLDLTDQTLMDYGHVELILPVSIPLIEAPI